jgi:hypothetical protein
LHVCVCVCKGLGRSCRLLKGANLLCMKDLSDCWLTSLV